MSRDERVIYIAGTGRNGSTVLGMLLEQASPDMFFAGEITHLWERGLIEGQLCGCEKPLNQCEFWMAVIQVAYGREWNAEVARIKLARDKVSTFRRIPSMLIGRTGKIDASNYYCQAYQKLIEAIVQVSGRSIIVDSSKYPTDLDVLCRSQYHPDVVLHLVRDCRAVVYAWKKTKRRTEIHWQEQNMPRYAAMKSAVAWRVFNSLIERIAKNRKSQYIRLQYEEFVAGYPSSVEKLIELSRHQEFHGDHRSPPCTIHLPPTAVFQSHSISGNPCRFNDGAIKLKLDEEWKTKLSSFDRIVVSAVAGRMQRQYGYS